jgi:hypothetical protein
MSKALRGVPTALVGALLAAVLLLGYTTQNAEADHQPADKAAISAATVDHVDDETVVLQETMRVSTPSDLILQLTTECSIITELATGGENADFSEAFGQVELWITIDGTPVPVAGGDEDGKVVFCNRTYGRTVTDTEEDGDVDAEDDYIRTRAANAFNWLAINTGSTYDSLDNGQNILDIQVWADYQEGTTGNAVADAFVGQRSLIIEPTKTSNHETSGGGVESADSSASGKGNGKN